MTMPEEADGGEDEGDDEAERHVVTVFLRNAGEILLLKRSTTVRTYAGRWGSVSGYAEGDPDSAARWEIDEETGLDDAVTFVRRGDPVRFTDDELGRRWVVHPFLFDCTRRAVDPNEEVSETAWVVPTELLELETVPELWTAYDRVRPTVAAIAHDTEHGSAWLSLRALEVLRDEAGQAWREGVGDGHESHAPTDEWAAVVETAEALLDARPTMAALENRVNRAMSEASAGTARAVERAARGTFAAALSADERAATTAAERLAGETVLTLSRSGTVERALSTEPGPSGVYVAESRPAREGVGVAERLAGRDKKVTLVTDAAVAHVLATGGVDRVVVGADTVLPDGSVVNKTGTRGAALVARAEDIPVDVVTAADKIATAERVVGESGPATEVYDGEAPLTVANPTFDRTPPAAVTGVVTDRGVLDADAIRDVAEEFRALAAWHDDRV
jgi:translation initiation factor 2B subunit (eIF-2B alpha/beta/delta family)